MKPRHMLNVLTLGLVSVLAPGATWANGSQSGHHHDPQPGILASRIDYIHVAALGQRDEAGRLLVWEGTIDGAFTGTMKWWFGPSPAPVVTYNDGRVVYYEARWEILDGDTVILAGESAGKTVIPTGLDGMWDGVGVVTEGSGHLNTLKGRKIYETGPVVFGTSPIGGTGMFVIQ